jgi:hypothetical protein
MALNSKYLSIVGTCTLYQNVNVAPLKAAAVKTLASANAYKQAFDAVDEATTVSEQKYDDAKDAARAKMDASIAAARATYATDVSDAKTVYTNETKGLGNNLASLSSQMTTDYSEFKTIYKADETLDAGVDVNVVIVPQPA